MASLVKHLVPIFILLSGRACLGDGITLDSFKHEKSALARRFAEDAAHHVISKARSGNFECQCMHHVCGDEFNIESKCENIGSSAKYHTCHTGDGCTPVKLHVNDIFLRSPPEQNLDFSLKDETTQNLVNEICLFKSLDGTGIFRTASEYDEKEFKGWAYIGGPSGTLTTYPGRARNRFGSDHHGASCEPYDATLRPWFGPAMSARKAAVILVHSSATQQAKRILAKVLTTLTYSDYVSIVVCDSEPNDPSIVHCDGGGDGRERVGEACLERATRQNVGKMKARLNLPSVASLVPAFNHAFDLLEGVGRDVDKMVMFMASGTFSTETTERVLQAVERRQKLLTHEKVSVLGYSFDTQNSDDGLARQLGCENYGVSMNVDASADMSTYFSFNSMAAEHADENPSYVHYTAPYVDAGHLGWVITTSMAMYEEFDCDKSSMGRKRRLLGVAGIDKKETFLERFDLKEKYIEDLEHVNRPLSIWDVKGLECQLQILRKKTGSECAQKLDQPERCFHMGNSRFYFIPPGENATFEAAREKCAKMGGSIASPDSSQKRALFASVVPRSGVWIQLHDRNDTCGLLGENFHANGGRGKGECAKIDPRGRTKNIVMQDCGVKLPYMCEFDQEPKECEGSAFDLVAAADDLMDAEKCEEKNDCKPPLHTLRVTLPEGGPLCNWPPYSGNFTLNNSEKERVCCSAEEYDRACPLKQVPVYERPVFLVFGAAIVVLLILLIPSIFLIRRWISRPPQPIPIPSSVLVIRERLGEGFSGEVFRGTWMDAGVAVKIFRCPDRQDAKSELAIFRVLPRHPNIIRCIGIRDGIEEGTVALILELMDRNLEDFVSHCAQHRGIAYKELFQVFYDVASGLDHLHRHNFLHLDLKPRNILINLGDDPHASPTVKLCDFGLSIECVTNSINLTETRGTPGYIAPEIEFKLLDSGIRATRKADIFSLGRIMRSCLVAEPDSRSQMRGSWETLDGIMPLIESCDRWDPAERPSAREVCTALKNLMTKRWANHGVFGELSARDSASTNPTDQSEMLVLSPFTNPPPRMWLEDSGPSADVDPETIYVDAESHA